MKSKITLLTVFVGLGLNAQVINKSFNRSTEFGSNKKQSVSVTGNQLNIKTRVIYNALPDGYHVTYTATSISPTIEDLEEKTTEKRNSIIKDLKKLKLQKNDVLVDVIGLDPIYSLTPDSAHLNKPSGYKSTHNFTFKIKDISLIDQLSRVCFNHDVYDLIDIVPFINSSKAIEDSLSAKAIEVLNDKKQLARDIGFEITDGKPFFEKRKNTIYPSERYLKSYINNASLYKHHISQNSTINYNRRVEIDAYYNLDLRDADFVFNAQEVKPVVQFIYELDYGFVKRDREEEARLKEERKEKAKEKKNIFILDKNGKMREVKF